METFTRISRTFEASHRTDRPLRCSRVHGHTFKVEITVAEFDTDLAGDADALLFELDGRDLGAMLTGGDSSLEGLAHWLTERILVNHPHLISLEVGDGKGLTCGVRRIAR